MATKGTVFRHQRLLDPSFTPGPGERYADAPKAVCRVTATRGGLVYYAIGADATKGRFYVDEPSFWINVCGEVLA